MIDKGKRVLAVSCLITALMALSATAFAHHGTGISYDEKHPIVVKGVVKEFLWRNPHTQLFLEVKDDKGTVVQWAFEMLSPGVLTRLGWTKHQFKPGDNVIMTVAPSFAGTPVGICYSPCKVNVNGVEMTR